MLNVLQRLKECLVAEVPHLRRLTPAALAIAAILFALYQEQETVSALTAYSGLSSNETKAKQLAAALKSCDKFCPPMATLMVSKAQDTQFTDQSQGVGMGVPPEAEVAPNLSKLYKEAKNERYEDAWRHPGVQTVAHSVASPPDAPIASYS